jgi:hypothetical protein
VAGRDAKQDVCNGEGSPINLIISTDTTLSFELPKERYDSDKMGASTNSEKRKIKREGSCCEQAEPKRKAPDTN